VIFKVKDQTIMATHADTVVNIGNLSKGINTEGIVNHINKINVGLETKITILMIAHGHVATNQLLDSGCELVMDGALSGADSFAQGIGIFTKNASQQYFEIEKGEGIVGLTNLKLRKADTDKLLDEIIEPVTGLF
jgi:hypothetical protein